MRVFLAEKPSVARELAQVLGCRKREAGFFRGKTDLVTWAVGHLVRLAEPAEMDSRWGQPWRREALPMLPAGGKGWPLVAEPRTEEQFGIIKRLFNDRRVTSIVNATDAGREGEAIFRRIYALSGSRKPIERLWTSSLTEDALQEAIRRLRPGAEYDRLASAALTRAQLDWLIGMNHTRAATLHNGTLCTIGRVQTPTLAMLVRRNAEIAGFVKTYFYEVHADMGEFIARAMNGRHAPGFDNKQEAEAILVRVPAGTPATVTEIEIRRKLVAPPQLHNLGELQKEANRRFGLTADQTLQLAQSLYEQKTITYPRSSSRHLSEDMVPALPSVLKALRLGASREAVVTNALRRAEAGPPLSKRFVDGSKLSDHHAIIPTSKAATGSLSSEQRKVYTIVAERFLGIFLPDKETEETRIDLDIAGHLFRAKGSRLLTAGWSSLSGDAESTSKKEDAEDRQSLPAIQEGQQLTVLDSELVQKERKPPARYTDATLLGAMETAGREIDDEALRTAMRGRGLGTEATRAAILQRLIDLGYVERDGKALQPTGKGIALVELFSRALPHLVSPELTGDMESKLAEIEAGVRDPESLLEEVAQGLRRDVPLLFRAEIMQAPAAPRIEAAKGELLCPRCQAAILREQFKADGKGLYVCVRASQGCTLTLSRVVAGKELSRSDLEALCSEKRQHRTRLIEGFRSKAGKKFAAHLRLNLQDGRIEFEFPR